MKNILLFTLSFLTFLMSSAQDNVILPKWEEGDFKKVTFENISPRVQEGTALYDTIITKFIWEVLEIQDTSVIFSMLPLELELKSDDTTFIEESKFFVDIFQVLRGNGVAINYIAHQNGSLYTPNKSSNVFERYNERYIQNDALKKAISFLLFSDSPQGQDQVRLDSIARFSLLSFIDPIISNIHTPFGQKFNFNQPVSTPEMTKEDWEVFLPSLDFEKSKKLFSGQFEFQELGRNIECPFKFYTDYMSPEPKAENLPKKKKRKSAKENFQFKFNYSGNYTFDAENHLPIRYFLTNNTVIQKGQNNFTKIFQKTILFE